MARKVFVNYRRDETAGIAGRLYDRLSIEFDKQNVFMDVDSIEPGLDFVKQLDDQVANCGILLAVIGPRWIDATDAAGERRLHKANDYVRVEIASALKRDIPVVPVLLDGAHMPQDSELPDDLKPLTRRQAVELRHSRFAADADVIIRSVRKALPEGDVPYGKIAAGLVAVALAGAAGAYWLLAPHNKLASVDRGPAQQASVEQISPAPDNAKSSPPPAVPDVKAAAATWRSFTVQPTLDRVRAGETFKRPYLGVQIGDLRPELAAALGAPLQQGAIVHSTVPDTPAAAAGIEPGDVITAVNRQNVKGNTDLVQMIADTRFGLKVPVVVWRMGKGAETFAEELAAAAGRGNAAAMTELGVSYANGRGVQQDYSVARQWYEKAANLGDAEAMTKLGLLYVNAQGVARDLPAARLWLQKAAEKDSAEAMYNLGDLYRFGQGVTMDAAAARKWLHMAADRGYARSYLALGDLYRDGQGGERDHAKARELYEKAAATTADGAPMQRLGALHFNGEGGPQSYDKAREWYEKAARRGIAAAMNSLGAMYFNGHGVARDYVKAREWYEYAGSAAPAAQSNLGYLYARGLGVKQDYDKARELFEQAAAKDITAAMAGLGDLYAQGHGVAQDEGKARLWYEKAAAGDYVSAMNALARIYFSGKGVAVDFVKAREWFEKAAQKGDTYAMAQVGYLYLNGHGVTADAVKAREWFEKSGNQSSALFGLALLYARGQGVPMDETKARSLYAKAGDLGSAVALHNLAIMEDKGRGGGVDPKAAARHELAAAKGGSDMAKRQLAGDMATWSEATRSAIQQELKSSGHYSGLTNGKWDADSVKAAEAYMSSVRP